MHAGERGTVTGWLRRLAALALGAVAAVGLAGCAGQDQSGSPAARVAAWVGPGGGGTTIGTVQADAANVGVVVAHGDPPAAVRTACALLATDANTAIGNLPAPDRRLTTLLDRAYTVAASAGDHCFRGAGRDTALMADSARERSEVPALLAEAVHRVEAVTGRTPSTATTAPPPSGDPFGGGGA